MLLVHLLLLLLLLLAPAVAIVNRWSFAVDLFVSARVGWLFESHAGAALLVFLGQLVDPLP